MTASDMVSCQGTVKVEIFSEYSDLKEIANDKYNQVSIGVVTS